MNKLILYKNAVYDRKIDRNEFLLTASPSLMISVELTLQSDFYPKIKIQILVDLS